MEEIKEEIKKKVEKNKEKIIEKVLRENSTKLNFQESLNKIEEQLDEEREKKKKEIDEHYETMLSKLYKYQKEIINERKKLEEQFNSFSKVKPKSNLPNNQQQMSYSNLNNSNNNLGINNFGTGAQISNCPLCGGRLEDEEIAECTSCFKMICRKHRVVFSVCDKYH